MRSFLWLLSVVFWVSFPAVRASLHRPLRRFRSCTTTTARHRAAFLLPARGRPTIPGRRRKLQVRVYTRLCLQHSSDPPEERTVVILYHKPPDVITSHSNTDATPANSNTERRTTVYEDIANMTGFVGDDVNSYSSSFVQVTGIHSKLHAIGRLDADTTGLLLLTNDGGLVHHVTNPSQHETSILKTYEAVIMGHWNDTALQHMQTHGVDIGAKHGGWVKVHSVSVLGHPTHKSTRVEIAIGQGKNRQVRRMFHAIQSGVMKLKRTRIGDTLTLGDLQEGQWRVLTNEEVKMHLDWNTRIVTNKPNSSGAGDNREGRRSASKKKSRRPGTSRASSERQGSVEAL